MGEQLAALLKVFFACQTLKKLAALSDNNRFSNFKRIMARTTFMGVLRVLTRETGKQLRRLTSPKILYPKTRLYKDYQISGPLVFCSQEYQQITKKDSQVNSISNQDIT